MPLTIKERNNVTLLIEPTTAALDSGEIEFVSEKHYTIISSPLGAGERISVLVYDYAKDTFNQMYIGGNEVYMTQYHEVITFANVSCVIKLSKGATASTVGVSIASR